jgi:hypothetical protein
MRPYKKNLSKFPIYFVAGPRKFFTVCFHTPQNFLPRASYLENLAAFSVQGEKAERRLAEIDQFDKLQMLYFESYGG